MIVCTLDEEAVIERCLASVAWADELLVLDSGSTDATKERAAATGARVVEQEWLGFSAQKNHAASLASHDWVLSVDADEVVTPQLAASIRKLLSGRLDPRDGYVVDRRGDFLGVLLPNGARRAKRRRFVRLYNRRHSAWNESMAVHEEVRCEGRRHRLDGLLLHWNDFSLDELIGLFNRYATIEAAELHAAGRRASTASVVYRPVLRFFWHFLATGDVRLGGHGVVHSGLKATADYMRYAKLWELDHPPPGTPRVPGSRCAFFLPNLDGGGAELAVLRLAEGFARRGLATDLVLGNASGAHLPRVSDRVRIVDLRARSPFVVSKTLALARYLRREQPVVLVAGLDIVSAATVARALSHAPTRIVMTVQTHLSRQFADKAGGARARRALVRALYRRADGLVAASSGTADDLARLSGVARQRIPVIYNPAVPEDLDALVEDAPDHPWLEGDGPPVILGIGRIVRQKDFPTLLRAFAEVRRRRPARLIILGDRDAREAEVPQEIELLIDQLGLREDVSLPGFVDNPYPWLARASVFAFSSAYEGFGIVVAEALATGTPVVATDCESGPREILADGRFGELVPVGDHAALAEAILRTLERSPDAALLRGRAEAFRVEPIVDQYLDAVGLAGLRAA